MINALELTRRETLLLGAAAFTSSIARNVEAAQDSERHGVSVSGDLKYPPDFEHFDYVDPNAPKGGTFSQVGATRAFNQNFLTFNSLNIFILRGDGAQGMELTFASLMARANDEPDALYGLAARAVQISADGLTYRFLMRPWLRILRRTGHAMSRCSRRRCRFFPATITRSVHSMRRRWRCRSAAALTRSDVSSLAAIS